MIDAKNEIFLENFEKLKKLPKNRFKNSAEKFRKYELFRLHLLSNDIYIISTLNHLCKK